MHKPNMTLKTYDVGAKTEVESIIKACNWLLELKNEFRTTTKRS